MAITNGKHIVKEFDGVNCTVVEEGVAQARVDFLKSLLEFNKFTVKVQADETGNFAVGVTDVTFNPTIAVYDKSLYTRTGHIVTPNIWNQKTRNLHIPYWTEGFSVAHYYEKK
ncbi:MAG: hypothetical protein LBU90_00350 [Bacteroidales bacterium]|jgi:hypothetical protein|nr:hypothetical protein [Bacteroidales bacterium]